MKNKFKKCILIFILAISMLGCSKNDEKDSNLPDYFGAELYSIGYGIRDDEEETCKFTFCIMSKIDIPKSVSSKLNYKGGKFDSDIEVIKYEDDTYKIDDYNLYSVSISIDNIEFENEKIVIEDIELGFGDKNLVLKPKRFELVHIEGEYSNNLIFTGTPLSTPHDMQYLSYDLNAEEKIIIKDVKLVNEDLKLTKQEQYKNLVLEKNTDESNARLIDINFKVDDELSKYIQYQSTAVFYFVVNDIEYINTTPINQFIFNDIFEYGNHLEEYYNEVLLKK